MMGTKASSHGVYGIYPLFLSLSFERAKLALFLVKYES
jgi:hypothetical protein